MSPALSFSLTTSRGTFYDLIQAREKTITTRKLRKRPIKAGDTLHLYWKQRVPEDQKPVHLIAKALCTRAEKYTNMRVLLLGLRGLQNAENYVKQEGFSDIGELVSYWTKEKPGGYGVMNGGLLFDESTWYKLMNTGPVQLIEWKINNVKQ